MLTYSMQALPDTEQEVGARLKELHLELEPLREAKRGIDGRVQRYGVWGSGLKHPLQHWQQC